MPPTFDIVYIAGDDSYETIEDAESIGVLSQRIMARLASQVFIDVAGTDGTYIIRTEDVVTVRIEEISGEDEDGAAVYTAASDGVEPGEGEAADA